MKFRTLIIVTVMLVLAYGVGNCYEPPDQIMLAKRFAELEALAADGSSQARQKLVQVSASKEERFQFRRFAYRLISRVGTSNDLKQANPLDKSDTLWSCEKLAEMRIAARENHDSKDVIANSLIGYLSELTSQEKSKSGGTKIMIGIQKIVVIQELGFQIADQNLPVEKFPSEVISSSVDIELNRLRKKYANVAGTSDQAKQIAKELYTQEPFVREAAVALLIEKGNAVVPTVIGTMESIAPDIDSSSGFNSKTRALRSGMEVLAGIGGEEARTELKKLSKSSVPYIAENARASLRWVDAGVKYPARYLRLFQHPYADE